MQLRPRFLVNESGIHDRDWLKKSFSGGYPAQLACKP